jgi:predicted secreted protein
MAIVSNQGRTVPELPTLTAGTIGNNDYLIIQNVSSNSTKKSTVSSFVQKTANLLTTFNNLNFVGPNNTYTGSFRSFEGDNYSVISQKIPNVFKRAIVSDYLTIGYNPSAPTFLGIYAKTIEFNQSIGGGGNITFTGNGINSEITVLDYPNGLTLENTPFNIEQLTASVGITGSLKGRLLGNVTVGIGKSSFNNVDVNNNLYAVNGEIDNATINGGSIGGVTINNSPIGTTVPNVISGSKIYSANGFSGVFSGSGNISLTGSLKGKLTGNVTATTGTSAFNNITAASIYSSVYIESPSFVGTASYSYNGNGELSSLSSSYAQTSSMCMSTTADTASYLVWSNLRVNGTSSYSYNGNQKYSSFSSSYALTSSKAISSSYSTRTTSASYALRASTVLGTVDNALNAITADSSTTSLTSSYLLKGSLNSSSAVPYFDGNRLTTSPLFYKNEFGQINFYVSASAKYAQSNFVVVNRGSGTLSSAGFVLQNKNRSTGYPNQDQWFIQSVSSGSLTLSITTGSYHLKNSTITSRTSDSSGTMAALKQIRNGFYFWPYINTDSAARDGSVGIGVTPPAEPSGSINKYLRAKLQIRMFSGSNEAANVAGSVLAGKFVGGAPVGVENKQTAILVQYGSSSFANTFYVSSSGDMRAYGSISGSKMYSYGNIKVDNGSIISKTDAAIITGSFKGNYQKDYTTVSATVAAATTNLSFDDYDMIYVTATASQTFNVNLTQKKVCYLYFYNNSGGTSFTWSTGTPNSLKWPGGSASNPSNGSRDLYSIVLMGSEILINRIGASYS